MKVTFSLPLLIATSFFVQASPCRADVPTPEQDCVMSRWATCREASGGLIGLQSPCPPGTETVRAYDPGKDCSPAAILLRQAQREEAEREESRVERDRQSRIAAQSKPTDMSKIPWTAYIPFYIGVAVVLFVLGLLIQQQRRAGKNLSFVLFRMTSMGVGSLVAGVFTGRWALHASSAMMTNHDGLSGAIISLAAAVIGFGVASSLTGILIHMAFTRLAGKPQAGEKG